jgi:hypothetical protein
MPSRKIEAHECTVCGMIYRTEEAANRCHDNKKSEGYQKVGGENRTFFPDGKPRIMSGRVTNITSEGRDFLNDVSNEDDFPTWNGKKRGD